MTFIAKTLRSRSRQIGQVIYKRAIFTTQTSKHVIPQANSDQINAEDKVKNVGNPNSVDKGEIDYFSGLGNDWWNKNGIVKPLHSFNKLRVPFIRDGVLENAGKLKENSESHSPLTDFKILDVGCGGGILSEPLAKIGAQVTGLDASADLISIAEKHSEGLSLNLNYVCSSIEDFSLSNPDAFDGVVASEIVEHVSNKEIFLEACIKALRPGGSLFITTMNKTTLAWLLGIKFAEDIAGLVPKGTHELDKFISPEDLTRILEKFNCRVKLVHGLSYFPITNNWRWTTDTSINYALEAWKK